MAQDDAGGLGPRLAAWDGSEEQAEALRAAVYEASPIRLQGKPKPGDRALAKVGDLYANERKSPDKLGRWLTNPKNASELPYVAPLIGDRAMGTWPFQDPMDIPEAEARLWLSVLASTHVVVDDAVRRFLRVMLQVRRRETWTMAAEAFAVTALRDEPLREQLGALWRACWPKGLPKKWPTKHGGGLSAQVAAGGRERAHLPRHTLVLACAWLAAGGDPELVPTLSAERLVGMKLPGHDADRSVVVRGFDVLLDGPAEMRAAVVAGLPKRVKELGGDVMTEETFRDVLEHMRADVEAEATLATAIRKQLIKARWKPGRLDALWSWLDTAGWFRERGDEEAVAAMTADAGGAALALELRLGTAPAPDIDGLSERLRLLLDEDRLLVMGQGQRATLLAETRAILAMEAFAHVNWPAVVRLSGGSSHPPMDGAIGEVGQASLGVILSHQKVTSRTMMRGTELSRDAVLRIADINDGFVATQVAVHGERLLRQIAADTAQSQEGTAASEEQVRFLWQLLARNPPARTFEELDLVLRRDFVFGLEGEGEDVGYSSGPLHSVVKSISKLDDLRDAGGSLAETADAFAVLVRDTQELLAEVGDDMPPLVQLAEDLENAADHADAVFEADWWTRLEKVALGTKGVGGLVDWAFWLQRPSERKDTLKARRLGVEKALRRLHSALDVVREARPSVTVEQYDEVVAATASIAPALGPLGWPEQRIVDGLMAALEAGCLDALDEGRKSRAVVEATRSMLEREDEPGLIELTGDSERLQLLPVGLLRDLHEFFLKHLLFKEARLLRAAVAERVPLPSPMSWMMPLYGAVAGGTFLVLDVGDAWLDLVKDKAWWRYGSTIAVTFVASFWLLLGSSGTVSTGSRLGRFLRHCIRVFPPFIIALSVSVAVSAIAMATLGRFDQPDSALLLLMWSALSLFLGVFVGLIVQGQGVTRRHTDSS